MGTIVTDDKHYKNIANTLREKLGTEDTFTPDKMVEGVDGVFEAGKTKEWSDFWDSYQTEGNRTNYDRAFQSLGWNDVTFKPKYDIKLTYATQCFMNSQFTDLKAILQRCGVSLVTGGGGNYSQMFQGCLVTHLPEMDISKSNATTNMFNAAKSLTSIDKLIVDENTVLSIFTNTSNLKDISFEGVIGTDVSFSSSPLSVASMKSIISHLKDYSGDPTNAYKYTVTFSSACLTLLDSEGNTSPNGNTWRDYAQELGWNI